MNFDYLVRDATSLALELLDVPGFIFSTWDTHRSDTFDDWAIRFRVVYGVHRQLVLVRVSRKDLEGTRDPVELVRSIVHRAAMEQAAAISARVHDLAAIRNRNRPAPNPPPPMESAPTPAPRVILSARRKIRLGGI